MSVARSWCLALAAGALLAGACPGSAQQVGTAGAVNPASTGTAPGRGSRTLTIGSGVVYRERIATSGSGSLQVVFADRSTLNVGPSANVTIDEFVYDPNAGTGRTALSVGRGILRYVGGDNSHNGEASVRTREAVLGIRGGTVTVERRGNLTRVIGGYGAVTVYPTAGGAPVLVRPGFAVTIGPGGVTDGFGRVGAPEVARSFALTTSRRGQRGGAKRVPSDALAARFGVGQGRVGAGDCVEVASPTFPGGRSSRCYGAPLDLQDEATRIGRLGRDPLGGPGVRSTPLTTYAQPSF